MVKTWLMEHPGALQPHIVATNFLFLLKHSVRKFQQFNASPPPFSEAKNFPVKHVAELSLTLEKRREERQNLKR